MPIGSRKCQRETSVERPCWGKVRAMTDKNFDNFQRPDRRCLHERRLVIPAISTINVCSLIKKSLYFIRVATFYSSTQSHALLRG